MEVCLLAQCLMELSGCMQYKKTLAGGYRGGGLRIDLTSGGERPRFETWERSNSTTHVNDDIREFQLLWMSGTGFLEIDNKSEFDFETEREAETKEEAELREILLYCII